MDDQALTTPSSSLSIQSGETPSKVRSLKELIDLATGRNDVPTDDGGDAGYATPLPYPFLAIVGQPEMKLALLLNLINPHIGGVILIGPRGTAKTTAVRSLLDLLPEVSRSLCFYGCLPEDIEYGGIDAVCPSCARKFGEGQPLTTQDRVQLVELPLNANLDDVVGGLDERALVHDRTRIKRGILSHADQNILFVDEANLLPDPIVNAILDAAATGNYTVRRGPVSATYRSRFILVGSMNPEEGQLRPQIMDRFGLRVLLHGLESPQERLEAYKRVQMYQNNPRRLIDLFADHTEMARQEILAARQLLPKVTLSDEITRIGLSLIQSLNIDSLRADITFFESARAHAAADARTEVTIEDLQTVAPISLRLRRSKFMDDYFSSQKQEENEILSAIKQDK